MIVLCTEQRTPEWTNARIGRLTGSVAGDMLARIKTGEAAARRDLRMRLVCERLTGLPQEDTYINGAMQWGIDTEPAARRVYELTTGFLVEPVGFLAHDTLLAGCSPDGLVRTGDGLGLLEIKCPKSATHLKYLRANALPSEYVPQVTHNLWITGAAWADFVSFDPRFPSALQFVRVRVERKQVEVDAYELMARTFLDECDREMESLMGAAAA